MGSSPTTELTKSTTTAAVSESNHEEQHQQHELMQIDQVFEELLMKMEVLSVQNQYQGQFGVIGSSKGKDWTSPLTPPPSANAIANSRSGQQNNQSQLRANATSSKSLFKNPSEAVAAVAATTNRFCSPNNDDDAINNDDVDVVDGRMPQAQTSQQQPHYLRQQHFYHHNQHAHQQYYQQQQHAKLEAANDASPVASVETAPVTYNNNTLTNSATSSPTTKEVHFGIVAASSENDDIDEAVVNEISQRLQAELRAAKSRHLACTEVSLPWDLTPRIAAEIVRTSEREPCGVRGGSIFIEFEDEPNNTRRIASFKVDPSTVSTFELYLTLKHDRRGWTSLLPQFLKNLTRSSTILISPDFTLTKNKLYSLHYL